MVRRQPPPSPIRTRREALGLNRETLAVRARLSSTTVALAERAGLVTQTTAERLAVVLGCRPEDLMAAARVVRP